MVAAEMATAYASLGSQVTLIARSRLLTGLEPFAGEAVGDGLRALGVEVMTGESPTSVTRTGGEVVIETSSGRTVVADEVLAAAGRCECRVGARARGRAGRPSTRRTGARTSRRRTTPRCRRSSSPIRRSRRSASRRRRRGRLNAQNPQVVEARGHFPTEQAALKTLHRVARALDPSGRGQSRWAARWKPALNAFAITFADRIPGLNRDQG